MGLFLELLTSCATKKIQDIPVGPNEVAAWETKAQIRQLRDNHIHNISIDVLAIKGDKLRMEATATLGIKVASVVVDQERVQALVYNEKKFYSGPTTPDIFLKAFRVPVPPNVFFAMIFDQSLRAPGWVCENDSAGLIQKCSFKGALTIAWERLENPPQKMVRIKSKTFEMDWFFKKLDSNWQPQQESFNLAAPDTYQVIKL